MDPTAVSAFESFLRHGSVLGLAFVFLAAVLGIIIWIAITVIGILKQWLPQYFQAQIKSHERVGIGINRLSRFVFIIYRRHETTHDATLHIVSALDEWFTKNSVKLEIPPAVIFHIKAARKLLEKQDMEAVETDKEGEEELPDDTRSNRGPDRG